MIVTRTEMFTDWVFQAAHSGEQSATVGRGLMSGHIYFRYAYDFLKSGETIQREMSFVELSDGSVYELGTGESSSKVTIVNHGVVSGGEIHLEVTGVSDQGIGVNRVLRHVTIAYDDGKTPVLDTEQLDGILGSLSESLTQSMVDTANAVKQELRNELNTNLADVQTNMQNDAQGRVDAAKNELTDGIELVDTKLDSQVSALVGRLDTLDAALRNSTLIKAARWDTPGNYTLRDGVTTNLLDTPPTPIMTSAAFELDTSNKSFKVTGGASSKPRILRVVLTTSLEANEVCDGNVYLSLRDANGSVMVQTLWNIDRSKMDSRTYSVQFSFDIVIDANSETHPALTSGIRVVALNRSGATVQFITGTMITATLTTVN